MSEEYYVKYKGRLQGPFTVKQLKSGIESGKLSRSHLASINRRNWVPLGEVEGVCEPEHVEEVVEEIAAEVESSNSTTNWSCLLTTTNWRCLPTTTTTWNAPTTTTWNVPTTTTWNVPTTAAATGNVSATTN